MSVSPQLMKTMGYWGNRGVYHQEIFTKLLYLIEFSWTNRQPNISRSGWHRKGRRVPWWHGSEQMLFGSLLFLRIGGKHKVVGPHPSSDTRERGPCETLPSICSYREQRTISFHLACCDQKFGEQVFGAVRKPLPCYKKSASKANYIT